MGLARGIVQFVGAEILYLAAGALKSAADRLHGEPLPEPPELGVPVDEPLNDLGVVTHAAAGLFAVPDPHDELDETMRPPPLEGSAAARIVAANAARERRLKGLG